MAMAMATQSLDILQKKWSRVREKKGIEVSRLYPDGYLKLKEDPAAWIQLNPHDLQLVRRLELNLFGKHDVKEIGDSIGELTHLTHFSIKEARSLKFLPNVITRLHNLQVLEIHDSTLEELPASLGELRSLTHLSLYWCINIQELPASLGVLHNLTHLSLSRCNNLLELPSNLGDLQTLIHLSLSWCNNLLELPVSLGKLHSLTHLTIEDCRDLQSLGEFHSLTHLTLKSCSNLRSMGKLHSLTHLTLENRSNLQSLGELYSLTHLTLKHCSNLQILGELHSLTHLSLILCTFQKLPASLGQLQTLYFESGKDNYFILSNLRTSILDVSQILINSVGMPRLSFLDLRNSEIKHFSVLGNIKNLPKLGILSLPKCFRLETLPFDLNDSLIISVDRTHVRKTWKELKIEMMWSFSDSLTASGSQNPFNISPHECLLLNEAPIWNLKLYKSVRLLDLSICEDDAEELTSLKELSQLTHLYIKANRDYFIDLKYLPNTLTRLKHLSLRNCDYEDSDCLDMLTNLESLDLDFYHDEALEDIDISVLVNLRCLTLQNGGIYSILDSMAKLSNLKTLVLFHCYFIIKSMPADMNLVKLKLINTFVHPLPTGLRHLEILHEFDDDCCDHDCCICDKKTDWKELVNLETLSITCRDIKVLPELGLLNLQELQLKDCFNLRKMTKVGKLSKLCTLNISGTRIMSLPDCITNLHNLKHLILPKCFIKESLPHNFGKKLVVTIDDIHEEYYKGMGFYDPDYETSSEDDNEITSDGEEVVDEDVTRISQDGHNTVQTSLHKLQNLPTPELGASSEFGQAIINNEVTLADGIFSIEPQVTQFPAEHYSHKREEAICEDSQHVLHSLQNQQTKVNNNHQSDDRKVTAQKIHISLEKIQSLRSSNITTEEAAKIIGVSKSTLKRKLSELKIYWPRSNKKKRPRNQNLAVGDNVPIESNVVNYSSNPTLTTRTVQECPTTTHGNMDDNQQNQEHLDILAGFSELLLNNEPPNESSSTFLVKATCDECTGRFNFCPTKSIDQLKEEVRKKLKLEDDDFHMEYKDEDQEWVIMNCMSDLIDATSLVKTKTSTGRDVIRLRVTHKNKRSSPTSMTTHMSQVIHDSFQSDIHQKAELGSSSTQWKSRAAYAPAINKMMTSDSFLYNNDLSPIMQKYLEGWLNVKTDGNCGFRVVADAFHGGEDNWVHARRTMYNELNSNTIYEGLYGGQQEVRKAMNRILWPLSDNRVESAPPEHWMTSIQDLFVIATCYNCVVIYFSFGATPAFYTILPLIGALPDIQRPHGELAIAYCGTQRHYIRMFLSKHAPLPPVASYWHKYCDQSVRGWDQIQYYAARLVFWEKIVGIS